LIDVALVPGEIVEKKVSASQVVVVIDVLRASTTIITALEAGASSVIPVVETEEAISLSASLGEQTVLGGERQGRRLLGFHLGNSPLEYTPEIVRGRVVVMTTTNGTFALKKVKGAHAIAVAAFRNAAAVAAMLRAHLSQGRQVLLVCAGTERRFTLEDACLAGLLVELVTGGSEPGASALVSGKECERADEKESECETESECEMESGIREISTREISASTTGLTDSAWAALSLWRAVERNPYNAVTRSRHGQRLIEMGFGADVEFCARLSDCDVIPILQDGRLIKLGG